MSMNTWPLNAPLGLLPQGMDIPLPTEDTTPVRYAEIVGDAYLAFVSIEDRKKGGYYLTPGNVARFMAERASCAGPGLHVLDPGSGTGILAAAVCEMASTAGSVQTLHVDAYETDPLLASLTHLVLAFSKQWLGERGVTLTFDVKREDFVLKNADVLRATRRLDGCPENAEAARSGYDLVISNPPYFKLSKSDPRAVAAGSIVHGQPNIYALFMAVSAELLSESGELVYIVPRSFSSGPYFRKFREAFFQRVAPKAIHLFESRSDVFKRQSVLQENLILTGRNRINGTLGDEEVLISHSETSREMPDRPTFMVSLDSVLNLAGKEQGTGHPIDPAGRGIGGRCPVLAQHVALSRLGYLDWTSGAVPCQRIPSPGRLRGGLGAFAVDEPRPSDAHSVAVNWERASAVDSGCPGISKASGRQCDIRPCSALQREGGGTPPGCGSAPRRSSRID